MRKNKYFTHFLIGLSSLDEAIIFPFIIYRWPCHICAYTHTHTHTCIFTFVCIQNIVFQPMSCLFIFLVGPFKKHEFWMSLKSCNFAYMVNAFCISFLKYLLKIKRRFSSLFYVLYFYILHFIFRCVTDFKHILHTL